MSLIWVCFIRRSYLAPSAPLRPSIFRPVNEPRPSYPQYYNYGAIGDADANFQPDGGDGGPPEDKAQLRRNIGSSSVNLFAIRSLHTGFNDASLSMNDPSAVENNLAVSTVEGDGCCGGRPNQFRLRRMARLVPALPAMFLLTSLIMLSAHSKPGRF